MNIHFKDLNKFSFLFNLQVESNRVNISSQKDATNQRGQSNWNNIAELQDDYIHSQHKNMIQGQNNMDYRRPPLNRGTTFSFLSSTPTLSRNSPVQTLPQQSTINNQQSKSPVTTNIPEPPPFKVSSASIQSIDNKPNSMHAMPSAPLQYNKATLRKGNVSPTLTMLQNQIQIMKNRDDTNPLHLPRQNSRESVSHSSSFVSGRDTPSFRLISLLKECSILN